MKRVFAMFIAVCVLIGLMLMTGCTPTEVSSVVLVVQQTANSQPPMLTNDLVTDLLFESMFSGGKVVIIEADGDPYVVDTFHLDLPTNIGTSKKADYARQAVDVIIKSADAAVPRTAEVDVVAALTLAARNTDPSADINRVLYLGSALSTDGTLSFSKEAILYSDASFVVDKLAELCAVPQFPVGTTVTFAGVGDVCEPQKPLDPSGRNTLAAIWEKTCLAGGADFEMITASPIPSDENRTFLPVSIVSVQEEYVSGVGKLDSKKVAFHPDSYELEDPEAVRELLAPLADLLRTSGQTILISGSTATVGSNDSCVDFSRKRGETIKQVLVALDVPEDQIIVKGLGYDHPFHIPDLNPDGSLNSNAEQNRCVFIYPIDSAEAKLMLSC